MLHAVAHVVHQLGLAGEPFLTLGAPIPDITTGQHTAPRTKYSKLNSPVLFLPLQSLDLLQRIRVNILGLFLLLGLPVVVTVLATTPGASGAVRPGRGGTGLVWRSCG